MPSSITVSDLKILKSEDISDFDEAGGRVTASEVVDGLSNSLFLDIPDTSRAYGDVDLVKVYAASTTNSNEPLLGSVVSLGRLPEDESVNITLFSTNDWYDRRSSAINTLESYLAPSSRIEGELLETQLKGQQAIQLVLDKVSSLPTVGKSLYIVQNEGKSTEIKQYVFVTSVSVVTRSFRVDSKLQELRVATVELSTKLDYTFTGLTAEQFFKGSSSSSIVRDTRVADTTSYYTTKPLVEAVGVGDALVKVGDIFTQIVPSARQDTPMSGLNPAGVSKTYAPTGKEITFTANSYSVTTSLTYSMGVPVTPNTLKIKLGTLDIFDKGGQLFSGDTAVGFVNYETGVLSWLSSFKPSTATLTTTFFPAAVTPASNDSLALEVTEGNRSLTLPWTLGTLPLPASLVVSYVVLGDVYTMTDKGSGELSGSNESFGVGTINYETGDVLLSFGSEPDVGSYVLLSWVSSTALKDITSTFRKKLSATTILPVPSEGFAIDAKSLAISWNDKSATVAGSTVLGDATGFWNGLTRTLYLEPNLLPAKDTQMVINYTEVPVRDFVLDQSLDVTMVQEPTTAHPDDALWLRFNVDVSDPELIRGSFVFDVPVQFAYNDEGGIGRKVVKVTDKRHVSGETITALYAEDAHDANFEVAVSNPNTQVGTIDYDTGLVAIDVAAMTQSYVYRSYTTYAIYRSA